LQVAWALEYLHGEGVLHLDVNPSNVFIRDMPGAVIAQQQMLDDGYSFGRTPGGTQVWYSVYLLYWYKRSLMIATATAARLAAQSERERERERERANTGSGAAADAYAAIYHSVGYARRP
jgi:serine/threonine protein kinase